MKIKDRILSEEQQFAIVDKYARGPLRKIIEKYLREQDKISLKAGMEKVARFADQFAGIKHNPQWIAQIKAWNLELGKEDKE